MARSTQTLAGRRPQRRRRAGYGFVAGYLILLLLVGVAPTLYAIWLAFSNSSGQLVGIGNFTQLLSDYRFWPAFENIAIYLVIWMIVLVVAVVGLALMLHGRLRRASTVARFVCYLPGALAGVASALVWMFMLDPSVSPVSWLLRDLGYSSFTSVIAPQRLPLVFAVMAFWTGAGGWIVVMYGALNTIPGDLIEAARMDGASAVKIAWFVQIPLLRKWIAYMLILAFATGTQLPILWLLLAPSKTDAQLVSGAPLSFGSWHDVRLAWDHVSAFEGGIIFTWLRNSAVYSFGALAITLVTAIPAGYGLALTEFIGRKTLLTVTLVVMLMPSAALVLPLFLEMNAVHELGSVWSVILPFSLFPFGVYLVYIYFTASVPKDMLAAARLDGCSEFQAFWHVALPLAKPVVALVAFFSFVGNWNNFFLPLVMLPNDQSAPIQVGLSNLLASTPAFNPVAGGADLNFNRPELALSILLAIAPILLVFLFSQRALVSGMLAGATKE
jgi:multiple sugar transport system permease protein